MKIKYVGGWSANNNSSYSDGYAYSSLRAARKSLRAMCAGNVFRGNTGYWYVNQIDADINDHIAHGTVCG